MLSKPNRLRSSKDFAHITKIGSRASTPSLVLYLHSSKELPQDPQVGFIISKAVGGSVLRHRIARQLRHAIREHLLTLPPHSQIVVRVLKVSDDFASELNDGIRRILKKSSAQI